MKKVDKVTIKTEKTVSSLEGGGSVTEEKTSVAWANKDLESLDPEVRKIIEKALDNIEKGAAGLTEAVQEWRDLFGESEEDDDE